VGDSAAWRVQQGRIFGLSSDGTLSSWETGYGVLAWSRPGITRYWPKAGTVLVEQGGQVQLIDAGLGTLTGTVDADLSGSLVGWKGDLFRLSGKTLQRWSDAAGWQTQATGSLPLVSAQGDADHLYVVDQGNQVSLWDGTALKPLWTGVVRQIVVGAEWLVVDAGTRLEVRSKTTGDLLRTLGSGGYDSLFAAKAKLFGLRQGTLTAVNLATGGTIWLDSGLAAVSVGDQVFAIQSGGTVVDYNAPDNLAAPTTALATIPAAPDGVGGWFVTAPQLLLNPSDPETSAVSTTWKVDTADWQPYEPLVLTDGVHSLAWHSADDGGLVELDKLAIVRVDTTAPTSTASWSLATLPGLPDTFGAATTLTLTGSDSGSGLAALEYRINQGSWQTYTAPVALSQQGSYQVETRARDQAGNVEAVHSRTVFLDYFDPAATASLEDGDHAEFVFLAGTTKGLPIDHFEFTLNGGPVTVFDFVIPFTTTGDWTIAYRAVDQGGRTSPWGTFRVSNIGLDPEESLGKVSYDKNLKQRDIVDNLTTSTILFLGTKEKFLSIPNALKGSAYLRGRATDSQSVAATWISVKVTGPTMVTYLKEPSSQAVLTGWTGGETLPAGTLSTKYFAQGHQVFTKTFNAGETIVLAGPKSKTTGGDLVFAKALWAGVQIIAPQPDTAVRSAQTLTLKAYTGTLPANITWLVSENGVNPTTLGPGNTVSYTLSDEADGGVLWVHAQGTVGGETVSTLSSFPILRQEKLFILYPNAWLPVKTNTAFTPLVYYTNDQGLKDTPPTITWTAVQNGQTVYNGPAPITLAQPGKATLTATLTTSAGRSVSTSVDLMVVGQWPWVTWHWWERNLKDWDDQHGEGSKAGKASPDSRQATTKTGNLTLSVWTWASGGDWRQSVDNGTYEIQMALGPMTAYEVHTVGVNNQMVNLMSQKTGQVWQAKFVVKVTDGQLKVTGTAGLPFYRVDYHRVDDSTPVSASVIGSLDNAEDLK